MTTRLIRAMPVAVLLTASLAAPAAAAVINGTNGPDVLVGTAKADTIRGYAGNDTLRGSTGADRLYGGSGADRLYPGKDSKTDVLRGGPGPDRINARIGPKGVGRDYAYAGYGNDRVRIVNTYGWAFPFVNCGPGEDTVVLPSGFDTTPAGCEHVVSAPSPND